VTDLCKYGQERRMSSSAMWRRVDLLSTDVSEERLASIFMIEKSASVSEERASSIFYPIISFPLFTSIQSPVFTPYTSIGAILLLLLLLLIIIIPFTRKR
jgi:membrane-bound ClpP family serine protease